MYSLEIGVKEGMSETALFCNDKPFKHNEGEGTYCRCTTIEYLCYRMRYVCSSPTAGYNSSYQARDIHSKRSFRPKGGEGRERRDRPHTHTHRHTHTHTQACGLYIYGLMLQSKDKGNEDDYLVTDKTNEPDRLD